MKIFWLTLLCLIVPALTLRAEDKAGSNSPPSAAATPMKSDTPAIVVDLEGSWEFTARGTDGTTDKGEVKFKPKSKTGEKSSTYSAVWTSALLGKVNADKVSDVENNVAFETVVDFGDAKIPVTFQALVIGDKLTGTYTMTSDGQKTEMKVRGARKEKTALTGPVNMPGSWMLDIGTVSGSVSHAKMVMLKENGQLVASLVTELGAGKIDGLKLDGNNLSFNTRINFNGVLVPIAFDGTVGGNKILGISKVKFQEQELEFPITGVKISDKIEPLPSAPPVSGEAAK